MQLELTWTLSAFIPATCDSCPHAKYMGETESMNAERTAKADAKIA
mgnify:CR=1 FL=1